MKYIFDLYSHIYALSYLFLYITECRWDVMHHTCPVGKHSIYTQLLMSMQYGLEINIKGNSEDRFHNLCSPTFAS